MGLFGIAPAPKIGRPLRIYQGGAVIHALVPLRLAVVHLDRYP